ncbi:hypothetical protein SELMODRAFT_404178 [Selaginella moellendorffii]|uniref:Uncharacterized protein WOX8-1 n=1 Tax=Selaginella moellendorffii TaxID=88036 RepID=D8QUI1_SELML|nr:WUSCHEL-related homeobox 13 [Selaginella moellendorffii]XP_002965624.1 WUSCHEL-related homeobox 13 [Selaginella moellendorffii]EFJ33044.1 hypothetical protein SELMODRAFT_407157 [Selaginella moellendorffii]EFJ35876.1 hypothetical protein SELMODRAFT_404178 [Selaginella moellendorffii]|eukprot:XP_002962413.1 WUSCHEL-related homeobox 13 [Selaginella moellendorffii]
MDLGSRQHFQTQPPASSSSPPPQPPPAEEQQHHGLVDMESIWTEDSAAMAAAAADAAGVVVDDAFQMPHFLLPPPNLPHNFAQSCLANPAQVMTEEQLETLRRQISVYATICQQLVEMHKATISHQHTYNGLLLGHQSPAIQDSSPMLLGIHHKPTSRQRWTPSQNQLRILERLFKQGNGTPNRQRIKEITSELSQHGQISETNVYNWFQNRKARAKRKQRHNNATPSTTTTSSQHKDAESEVETDGDHSPEEKRSKVSSSTPQQQLQMDQSNTTTEAIGTRYAVVMLNGKAWKVKPGRINVRSNFGDNAVLLDPRGHVVATSEQGLTLDPLQPGGSYTVAV